MDLLLIVVLAAGVVFIAARGPSTTHAYAQVHCAGSVLSITEGGHWLLPYNQTRGLYRKPQLYLWLAALAPMATGLYNDFMFRLPTIAAFLVGAVMVYSLGRRWYGRRTGLLAACLWITIIHMVKLAYLAMTDMLFAACIIGSILCADRLLFHRGAPASRWKWAVGFWVTMILGALTKGWGLVNPVLVGGTLALATALGPGWRPVRALGGRRNRLLVVLCLIGRRWKRALKALHVGWGLLAMAAVLGPLLAAMILSGGDEFRHVVYREFWQRLTGAGPHPPLATSVPPILQLLYYGFPASFFGLGALCLVHPRRWFARRSPVWLPLCWVLAVGIPFSLAHGFRPDYLLPCYAAVALSGAWGVNHLAQSAVAANRRLSLVRHFYASVPILAGALVAVLPVLYFLGPHLARPILKAPATVAPLTRYVLYALPAIGIVVVVVSIMASLRWRIRALAWLAIVALPGTMFVKTHVLSAQARSMDGEKMIAFARAAVPIVGDDEVAVFRVEHACVQLYLGRFGRQITFGIDVASTLNDDSRIRWLIISDRGLAEAGAARPDPAGLYRLEYKDQSYAFEPEPERLGTVRVQGEEPIQLQDFGRLYLIEIQRPVGPLTPTGPQEGWEEYDETEPDDA